MELICQHSLVVVSLKENSVEILYFHQCYYYQCFFVFLLLSCFPLEMIFWHHKRWVPNLKKTYDTAWHLTTCWKILPERAAKTKDIPTKDGRRWSCYLVILDSGRVHWIPLHLSFLAGRSTVSSSSFTSSGPTNNLSSSFRTVSLHLWWFEYGKNAYKTSPIVPPVARTYAKNRVQVEWVSLQRYCPGGRGRERQGHHLGYSCCPNKLPPPIPHSPTLNICALS